MIHKNIRTLLLLFCCYRKVFCETNKNVEELLKSYEKNVNSSLHLDKQDRLLINSWKSDVQIKVVNVTTEFRLQMTRHKTHNFWKKNHNKKWQLCLIKNGDSTTKSESQYYKNESGCLKLANAADENRVAVDQVEKEIRKWRKSYRYLKNRCHSQNTDDEDAAASCLVEYMQKDNFDKAFERLMHLKLDAMGMLFKEMYSSVDNLEECLRKQFSEYLENLRNIMYRLNVCYSYKKT